MIELQQALLANMADCHPEIVTILSETLQAIAKIFARAILWDKKEIGELKRQVALFRAYFSHCMPCERGSAAEGDLFEALLYAVHGYTVNYTKDKMIDLEALTTPVLSEFLKNYDSMISLDQMASEAQPNEKQ